MKELDNYIIEKLRIDKNTVVKYSKDRPFTTIDESDYDIKIGNITLDDFVCWFTGNNLNKLTVNDFIRFVLKESNYEDIFDYNLDKKSDGYREAIYNTWVDYSKMKIIVYQKKTDEKYESYDIYKTTFKLPYTSRYITFKTCEQIDIGTRLKFK
jgi:hypothetical protein